MKLIAVDSHYSRVIQYCTFKWFHVVPSLTNKRGRVAIVNVPWQRWTYYHYVVNKNISIYRAVYILTKVKLKVYGSSWFLFDCYISDKKFKVKKIIRRNWITAIFVLSCFVATKIAVSVEMPCSCKGKC